MWVALWFQIWGHGICFYYYYLWERRMAFSLGSKVFDSTNTQYSSVDMKINSFYRRSICIPLPTHATRSECLFLNLLLAHSSFFLMTWSGNPSSNSPPPTSPLSLSWVIVGGCAVARKSYAWKICHPCTFLLRMLQRSSWWIECVTWCSAQGKRHAFGGGGLSLRVKGLETGK